MLTPPRGQLCARFIQNTELYMFLFFVLGAEEGHLWSGEATLTQTKSHSPAHTHNGQSLSYTFKCQRLSCVVEMGGCKGEHIWCTRRCQHHIQIVFFLDCPKNDLGVQWVEGAHEAMCLVLYSRFCAATHCTPFLLQRKKKTFENEKKMRERDSLSVTHTHAHTHI